MKLFVKPMCLALSFLFMFYGCSQQDYVPLWKGSYFGQRSPGMTAELFDPGIFNEGEFLGCSGFFNDGTIYYMSRREVGAGRTDVWRSQNLDGVYGEAENLGDFANTEGSDIDPFVAPDESYLIVYQEKEGGFEVRPYVTPDGKYLFFTSNREESEGGEGIYWVDAKVIGQLKPKELK